MALMHKFYMATFIPAVLEMFLPWVSIVVEEVNMYYNLVHYPSCVGHNRLTFDFPILLAEHCIEGASC